MHTGNILTDDEIIALVTVYPCAYREHTGTQMCSHWFSGLSLCIQGTSKTWGTNQVSKRFIPVHTGNIARLYGSGAIVSVYPCAYREHTNYNILFYN